MNKRTFCMLIAMVVVAGCASSTTVQTGVNTVGKMRVTTESGWTSITNPGTPDANGLTRTWTKTGLPQDRLILISGIKDGDPILKSGGESFRSGMSATELQEVVQSAIPALTGTSSSALQIRDASEQSFGLNPGVVFEFSGGAAERGIAGAFVFEDALYVNLFVATDAGTFASVGAEAEAVIRSATGNIKTIRRY